MKPKVSIIIVNWNGRELLEECFRSIEQYPPTAQFEIVVVDNDSRDESVPYLREMEKTFGGKLRLILNKENVGFGRANNQAMRECGSDHFFLLNSDALVQEHTLDRLIAIAESDENIGVVGPRVQYPDGTIQPSIWRNPPSGSQVLIEGLRLYKLLPKRVRAEMLLGSFWPHDEQREVELIPGAAMLIKRAVFETVGGFDEDFFMYGEDLEYSARIRRNGWKLVFTPDAVVEHKNAQSSEKKWGSLEKLRRYTLGQIMFMEKAATARQARSFYRAMIFVLRTERFLRKMRGLPYEDVQTRLDIFLEHRQTPFEDLPSRHAAA